MYNAKAYSAASAPTRLAYDKTAAELAARFEENFKQFDASEAIRAAGPKASKSSPFPP